MPQPFSNFSFTTVQAGPRASIHASNKENLMPLLGFEPPFPVHPLHSPNFLKNIHLFVLPTLQEMEHTFHLLHQNTNVCYTK